jgi:hypothetical protein
LTEQKRNANPFVALAKAALEEKNKNTPTYVDEQRKFKPHGGAPKPSKGHGNKIIKKTGRA